MNDSSQENGVMVEDRRSPELHVTTPLPPGGLTTRQVALPEPAARIAAPRREYSDSGNESRSGEDIALKLYLKEISETALLTPDDEVMLAALIQKGDEAARERMIKANLRLVVKIANDYSQYGVPLLDLINEGNIGLMKAVERFDPAKGGKLSTYSSFWIKQAIRRALANQAKTIRLPVHLISQISHMRRKAMELQEELGREPSDEELAAEIGITETEVRKMQTVGSRPTSLDSIIGDDETSRLGDIVPDENAINPYEELEEKTVLKMLRQLMPSLSPREIEILKQRFGFDGNKERTLDEVGEQFGITRERIRQIQNNAISKLRRLMRQYEGVQK